MKILQITRFGFDPKGQGGWLKFIGSEEEVEPNETSNSEKFIGSIEGKWVVYDWDGAMIDWEGGIKGDDVIVWEGETNNGWE